MEELMLTTFIGFMVGIIGTVLGGVAALKVPARTGRQQSMLLGISGGIMTAVVLWDLWPEAIALQRFSAVGGGLFGVGFILVAGFVMARQHREGLNRLTRTGLLMGLGIGFHNFPEGLAVGTLRTTADSWRDWAGMAGLMAAHNVPEGVVVAASLRMGKVAVYKILAALFLVELPMAMGALLGGVIVGISQRFVAASLGFASGAMISLVMKEMLPMGRELSTSRSTAWGFGVGLLLGGVLTRML